MNIQSQREFLINHYINVRGKYYEKARLSQSIHRSNRFLGLAKNLDQLLKKIQSEFSDKWIQDAYQDLIDFQKIN